MDVSSFRYNCAGEEWWIRRRPAAFGRGMADRKAPTPSSRHVYGPRIAIDRRTGKLMPSPMPWNLDDARLAVRFAVFVATIGIITLLGVAVRASHLSHPMRYDESYNYLHYVTQGPLYIVTHYVPNNHILHTISVWAVGRIAGHSPSALRIPAFLAGILLIPATAWLAWTLFRRKSVALLSSLAVCCSSALVEYSVNARGYTMLALFAVLAALALLHALQQPQRRWRWIAWGMICAAGMYTIPIMALPFLGMTAVSAAGAALSADADRRALTLRGLGWGSAACILPSSLAYLPVLIAGGLEPFTKSQEMAYQILGQQISSPMQMVFGTLVFWTRHASMLLVIVVSLGTLAYLLQTLRARETHRWILLGVVVVPLFVAIVISAPLPARTWLFALPFLLIMAALGLVEMMSDDSSAIRRILGQSIQLVAALAFIVSLSGVWKSEHLCSEPGGLVLVEPALEECRSFGAQHCALVSPYTPATAYYKSRTNAPSLANPSSTDTQRVYILTSNDRRLDDLWCPGVDGYEFFAHPQPLWDRPGGKLYVAERAPRNVLR